MPKKTESSTPPPALIYLGPPIRTEAVHLSQRTVFRNGLPASVQAMTETDADLAGCFVPVAGLGQALRDLAANTGDIARSAGRVSRTYTRR